MDLLKTTTITFILRTLFRHYAKRTLTRFQPGGGPSRGLLCDYESLCEPSFEAIVDLNDCVRRFSSHFPMPYLHSNFQQKLNLLFSSVFPRADAFSEQTFSI